MAAQVAGNMDGALAALAMSSRSRQTFMYGTFLWMQKPRTQAFLSAASEPPSALKAFGGVSAPELVGTRRTMPLIGHCTISPIEQLLETAWSEVAKKAAPFIVFDMDGAGPWEAPPFEVLDFKVTNGMGALRAVVFRPLRNSKASTHFELPWVSASRPMDRPGGSRQCPRC